MCRSELFDKSLERERERVRGKKKSVDSRKIKHKIFQKTNVPITFDYVPFPLLLVIRRMTIVS